MKLQVDEIQAQMNNSDFVTFNVFLQDSLLYKPISVLFLPFLFCDLGTKSSQLLYVNKELKVSNPWCSKTSHNLQVDK